MKTGRIYRIISNSSDKIYIGSTCKDLDKRLMQHKTMYKMYLKNGTKRYTSFDLIKLNDASIELIEEFEFNNKIELLNREKEHIRTNPNTINKNIPTRTKAEYYIDKINKYKNYYINNREKLLAYQNKYNRKKKIL
jgi:hypothetical protein